MMKPDDDGKKASKALADLKTIFVINTCGTFTSHRSIEILGHNFLIENNFISILFVSDIFDLIKSGARKQLSTIYGS